MTAVNSIGSATLATGEDGALVLKLAGPWQLQGAIPDLAVVEQELERLPPSGTVAFETSELTDWDSSLLARAARLAVRGVEIA
jgi:hypothetical protein